MVHCKVMLFLFHEGTQSPCQSDAVVRKTLRISKFPARQRPTFSNIFFEILDGCHRIEHFDQIGRSVLHLWVPPALKSDIPFQTYSCLKFSKKGDSKGHMTHSIRDSSLAKSLLHAHQITFYDFQSRHSFPFQTTGVYKSSRCVTCTSIINE